MPTKFLCHCIFSASLWLRINLEDPSKAFLYEGILPVRWAEDLDIDISESGFHYPQEENILQNKNSLTLKSIM